LFTHKANPDSTIGFKYKKHDNPLLLVLKELFNNRLLYIMALPGIVLFFIFSYLPMVGITIAFKNFRFDKGFLGSAWADPIYKNFLYFFTSEYAWRVTRNTLALNAMFILIGTIVTVALALMVNEIGNKYFKKITQNFMFLPHFVSWIIVGVFAYNLFSYDYGVINSFMTSNGLEKVDWYSNPYYWPFILLAFNIWKGAGFGTVIYLAVLSGIDLSYYEAAKADGATRLQQIWYISIPMLMPTVLTLTILAVGRIMNADFGMFYALIGENSQLFKTTDVIDTFVFRSLRRSGDIPMSSAAGFYQSCVSFILILLVNKLAGRYNKEAALF